MLYGTKTAKRVFLRVQNILYSKVEVVGIVVLLNIFAMKLSAAFLNST